MKIKFFIVSYCAISSALALGILMLQGCATEGKSLVMGGAIGAGTGAILGGIADPGKDGQYRTRNVIIGSTAGGMAGMVAGAMIHENTVDKQRESYASGQKSMANRPALPTQGPNMTQAKVEIQWVEGRVVGNKWIDGHYERIISEPARWETSTQ